MAELHIDRVDASVDRPAAAGRAAGSRQPQPGLVAEERQRQRERIERWRRQRQADS